MTRNQVETPQKIKSGLFTSGFPIKTLYTFMLSPKHITCAAHRILFDFTTRTMLSEE
jgi:hypothetical protein